MLRPFSRPRMTTMDDEKLMVTKIIEFVQKYPCLYDSENVEYKNVQMKAEKWKEIGWALNMDGKFQG